MARKYNDLYIGYENFKLEHNKVKHPATIEYYNSLNINKIKEEKIELVGLDLETNHLTSDLMLLGFYDKECGYEYFTNNFLGNLFNKVKYCSKNKKSGAYWNKLDPFVIYKQFLNKVTEEEQITSLKRFGKLSGQWDRKKETFKEQPIISVKFNGFEFGIMNIIRSSIQFYYISDFKNIINKVWFYDIAVLYNAPLSVEGLRFNYYSKVDESAHLVDWKRFNNDKDFRENIVLKSNYLDAKVCKDLGDLVQEDFKKAFGYYPNTLISAGSLTRSAIVSSITNYHKEHLTDEKEIKKNILEDLKSIPLSNYEDEWREKFGIDITKDLFCMASESYSGGYIETLGFGYSKEAFMSDIASAYPSIEVKLYDLRNAKITTGKGTPPEIKNSYCFIRGIIKTPKNLNFNPVTIKHPFSDITNIRGTGEYKASYLKSSRDLLLKYGCSFYGETWINIETEGKISPFARAINSFLELRTRLLKEGDSAQDLAKKCANSGYGITYECTPIYKEIDGKIINTGYRAGEFYNSIYASIITGEIRNLIAETSFEIEKNGGKVLLIMTDSIFWKGKINNINTKHWRENKTLGYFEKPIQINDFLCLGSGRYEYMAEDKEGNFTKYKGKTRGFNISDFINEHGIVLNYFNWKSLIYKAQAINKSKIEINTRILVSPPIVLNYKKYGVKDMGLVRKERREVDILAGKSKRLIYLYPDWLKDINKKIFFTKPLYIFKGMGGYGKVKDFTLSAFRKVIMEKEVLTKTERTQNMRKEQNKRYYINNQEKKKRVKKEKYQLMRKYGFDVETARTYSSKNFNEVYKKIGEMTNGKY